MRCAVPRLLTAVFLILISFESLAADQIQKEFDWQQDAWENFKSPVTTDAKYFLFGGAGLTATLLFFEDQIVDPVQHEAVEDKPLGSTSKLGDLGGQGITNALYVAGMISYGLLAKNSESMRDASGMLQATAYSVLVTTSLKYTVREPRPNDSNTRNSFPSGHTTAAFAFASYVGCRHSLPWGIAAYAFAAFVGFSRVNDNAHYLHDVAAGAAIGGSYGLGICLSENRRTEEREPSKHQVSSSWYVAPISGGFASGLTLNY